MKRFSKTKAVLGTALGTPYEGLLDGIEAVYTKVARPFKQNYLVIRVSQFSKIIEGCPACKASYVRTNRNNFEEDFCPEHLAMGKTIKGLSFRSLSSSRYVP